MFEIININNGFLIDSNKINTQFIMSLQFEIIYATLWFNTIIKYEEVLIVSLIRFKEVTKWIRKAMQLDFSLSLSNYTWPNAWRNYDGIENIKTFTT